MRNVVYGLKPPTNGTFTVPQPGLIPWGADFGTVVRTTMGNYGKDQGDFITSYTVAMKEWLSDVFAAGGNSLPVVTGRPKQAFSHYWFALPDAMKATYLQACGGGGSDQLTEGQKNVPPPDMKLSRYPLPFISFFPATAPKFRDGRSVMPLRNLSFLDSERGVTGWAKHPTPYTLQFQVDVWTKYETMHNWMYSLFDQAFQNEMSYLQVPNPYFTPAEGGEPVLGAIRWADTSDNSDLEVQEDADSVFRWTMSVEVEAWRFYDMRQAPVAKRAVMELVDYSGPGSSAIGEVTFNGDAMADVEYVPAPATGPPG